MTSPLISIIMPSFRQANFLEEAIRSVLDQDYPHRELLVMDGGSDDGSVDILRRYESRLAYWTSAPDAGQSDALHRGIGRAKGDLICWVNSDDVLLPGALSAVASVFSSAGGCDWIVANCMWLNPTGHVIRCCRGLGWSNTLSRFGQVNVSAPSSFFSPSLYHSAGGVEHHLHYMMDTELWLKFARCGARFIRLDRYVWGLRLHPDAKMSGHNFATSTMANPDHPVWAKRRAESEYVAKVHGLTANLQMSGKIASRAYRTLLGASARAWLDYTIARGQHWSKVRV